MQRVAADELHVEGDHFPSERMLADDDVGAAKASAGVFYNGEGLGQDFVEPLLQLLMVGNFGKLFFPSGGLLPQGVVRQLLQFRLVGIDLRDHRPELLDLAVVFRADEFLYDKPNHGYSETARRYENNGKPSKT